MKKVNPEQSRRSFLRSLAGEIFAFTDEMKGIPQQRLNKLPLLSDAVFEKIVPVFFKESAYIVEKNVLMKIDHKTNSRQVVRVFDAHETFILKHIDEINAISKIAARLCSQIGTEPDKAFQQVKSLFLELVNYGVCHPKQALDLDSHL